jgi:hypothetical protein
MVGMVNGEHSAIHVMGRDMGAVSNQLHGAVVQATEHWSAIIIGGLWIEGVQLVELTAIGAGEQP